jgi:predicted Zn-dependent protease with MMP-like domain
MRAADMKDTATFEQLVEDVLDSLPPMFAQHLDNVEFIIEQRPTRQHRRQLNIQRGEIVYGCYEGVPLPERSTFDIAMPATIILFQQPLEQDYPDPVDLREQVRRTLLHEVAHHFGISDERLDELGAY